MASHSSIHPEDVKALIRKRFGSLQAFERAKGLPIRSVSDLLRGKMSQRVAAAVDSEIGKAVHESIPGVKVSDNSDNSAAGRRMHRLNARAA
jgi:lambda repressor-like predicted transcriptional regulator